MTALLPKATAHLSFIYLMPLKINMLISYCTTCHGRLWQLKQTLGHNLAYTVAGKVELCVLLYNDADAYEYLRRFYADYITDGRLRILSHVEDRIFADGSRWSCGYVKDLAHKMGRGRVLFNLDADNFIDDPLHAALLALPASHILITRQSEWRPDGRSGRIGIHREKYGKAFYRDRGRSDDGDFISQCIALGAKVQQIACQHTPIDNDR